MRRAGVIVSAAVLLAAVVGWSVPAGAGEGGSSTVVIRKVVTGPATTGSSVAVSCTGSGPGGTTNGGVLNFDATGAPTTATGALQAGFSKLDGAWVYENKVPDSDYGRPTCTATETETGGAESTAWTCTLDVSASTTEGLGCVSAAGTGVGPATATFGDTADKVLTQVWTVVFTNTYAPLAPDPVEISPTFTG
jgi:hypothetical protein